MSLCTCWDFDSSKCTEAFLHLTIIYSSYARFSSQRLISSRTSQRFLNIAAMIFNASQRCFRDVYFAVLQMQIPLIIELCERSQQCNIATYVFHNVMAMYSGVYKFPFSKPYIDNKTLLRPKLNVLTTLGLP